MRRFFSYIPSLFFLWLIYNGLAGYQYYVDPKTDLLHPTIGNFLLPSGARWGPSVADLLVILGIIFLYWELFKSTDISNAQIIEHLLSFILVVIFLGEFVLSPLGADSAFVALMVLACLDLVGGFTITITAARRDFHIGGHR